MKEVCWFSFARLCSWWAPVAFPITRGLENVPRNYLFAPLSCVRPHSVELADGGEERWKKETRISLQYFAIEAKSPRRTLEGEWLLNLIKLNLGWREELESLDHLAAFRCCCCCCRRGMIGRTLPFRNIIIHKPDDSKNCCDSSFADHKNRIEYEYEFSN